MSEIEEVRLKIKKLEETWIGYLESYNNELIPICHTITEDMEGRLDRLDKEEGEPDLGRRTHIYCSWQEYKKYKLIAYATRNDENEFRFIVEICSSGRYGNSAIVEWFENKAEFLEWLSSPDSVEKLEQIYKNLYCNHFLNLLGLMYVKVPEEDSIHRSLLYTLNKKVKRWRAKIKKYFHKRSSNVNMEDFDLDWLLSEEDL
ncbi:MAG: hypothetical protein KBT06_03605 [Prevotellaceae bacterium]|nr:hypothetical protein [Candidatus Colivivens equi]